MVEVNDNRLKVLNEMYKPEKLTPAVCEFTDIAGLVKGASKGEGLGNQFLDNIRKMDAILHVVRCFENDDIIHVEGSVDSLRDVDIINMELIFSDLDQVQARLPKIKKKAQSKVGDAPFEYALLSKLEKHLSLFKPIRLLELSDQENEFIKNFGFLTNKPLMYIANVEEKYINDASGSKEYQALVDYASKEGNKVVAISAQSEAEISELDDEDKEMFLEDLGITEPGLDKLVRATYDLLGLATYFTAGPKEVRAWTYRKGMTAPECAGIIHTDFERGFIKAETVSFKDLVASGSLLKAKEKGLVRQEGRDYKVVDGDVMLFKFNV